MPRRPYYYLERQWGESSCLSAPACMLVRVLKEEAGWSQERVDEVKEDKRKLAQAIIGERMAKEARQTYPEGSNAQSSTQDAAGENDSSSAEDDQGIDHDAGKKRMKFFPMPGAPAPEELENLPPIFDRCRRNLKTIKLIAKYVNERGTSHPSEPEPALSLSDSELEDPIPAGAECDGKILSEGGQVVFDHDAQVAMRKVLHYREQLKQYRAAGKDNDEPSVESARLEYEDGMQRVFSGILNPLRNFKTKIAVAMINHWLNRYLGVDGWLVQGCGEVLQAE